MKIAKIYLDLGRRIGGLRRRRGISQEKLALQAGINRGFMGKIERGQKRASVETLAKVARVLEVELPELFRV